MSLYQFVHIQRNTLVLVVLTITFGLLTIIGCEDDGIGSNTNQPGTVQFISTSYNVTEGTDGFVNIIVARSNGSNGTVSVEYATDDGSAMAGSDYAAMNGSLIWTDGLSGNQTIVVPITDDNTAETSESFMVTLSNVSLATLGADSATTVTIIDDD